MARADKLLAAMRASPQSDWSIGDVETICRAFGIACKAPKRGSHYTLSHPGVAGHLTVPARRPIKAGVYSFAGTNDRKLARGMSMDVHDYRVLVEPLSASLGGGVVSYAPALKGCISDGATPDEALHNIYDAIDCWIAAARDSGAVIPAPEIRQVA